ncbi:MAG: hypothetical protein AVDCRST_MAG11-1741, partial [uncultured Gemmatimonadaceae bacterium]
WLSSSSASTPGRLTCRRRAPHRRTAGLPDCRGAHAGRTSSLASACH